MRDNFMRGHEGRGVFVGIADRERCKTNAGLPPGKSHDGNVPREAARWKGLQQEAAVRVPTRIKGLLTARRRASAPGEQAGKLLPGGVDQRMFLIAVLSLLLGPAPASLSAAPGGDRPAHPSARELVQDVVREEKEAREHPENYYKYVQQETTPEGSKTSVRIETPNGEIGATVSVDGKPPSQAQCRKDSRSLKKFTTDADFRQRQLQEQKKENERVDKLMAAIPQAFIFRYKGKQQGRQWRIITFRPDPSFQPQSRETALLKGMQGTLWVDRQSHRLVKIEGRLVKDVNFGWGFLASIYSGGHFALQQSKVDGGSWKATFLKIDLDGNKLVFGKLKVHFKDKSRSYVPLANPPTLAHAVHMLEQSATACRQSQGRKTTAQAQMH